MNCPKHPDQSLKPLRLDVYGCPEWLIHKLSRPYDVHLTNEAKET